jgi:hypothetical protein
MRKHPVREIRNAAYIGNPAQVTMVKKMKAPNASNSPWAKFNTLEDLNIMTKPMAAMP